MIKDQIDNLRAWAITGVVIIHVTSYFMFVGEFSYLPVLMAGADIYAHFAVPLFVLISGLVLGLKYSGDFSVKEFYKKRIHRIMIPYLIWSAVYISISDYKGVSNILFKLLSGSGYYHLWYFFLIIQLYFLFPFIRKFLKNKSIFIILILLILQTAFNQLQYLEYGLKYITVFLERFFLSHLFYFCLGIWIADNIKKTENFLSKFSSSAQFAMLMICILISYKYSYSWLAHYNVSLGIFKGSRLVENIILPFAFVMTFINLTYISDKIRSEKITNLLNVLSKYSFGIYLSHILILEYLVQILNKTGITQENIVFYFITFIGTMALSVIFCYIIEKTILSKPLLGINQAQKAT